MHFTAAVHLPSSAHVNTAGSIADCPCLCAYGIFQKYDGDYSDLALTFEVTENVLGGCLPLVSTLCFRSLPWGSCCRVYGENWEEGPRLTVEDKVWSSGGWRVVRLALRASEAFHKQGYVFSNTDACTRVRSVCPRPRLSHVPTYARRDDLE